MANPTARPLSKRVLLMGTCLCDAFYDDVARATVEVLEHLGYSVDFPENQTCCGQPAFNSGDWPASRKVAKHTAGVFSGDLPVIVPSGSCAAMNRHGNLLQFEENPDAAVTSLADRTWEAIDFIFNGIGIKTWPGKFERPTRIAFHRSCHSRGTETGAAVRTLLASIGNAEVIPFGQAEQCCGFGGTFSVKHPAISGAMVNDKVDDIQRTGAARVIAGDCGCLMNITGAADRRGLPLAGQHLAEFIWERTHGG